MPLTRQQKRERVLGRVAALIADRLLTSGFDGKKVDRLVLTTKEGIALSGWCERAVADQAQKIMIACCLEVTPVTAQKIRKHRAKRNTTPPAARPAGDRGEGG